MGNPTIKGNTRVKSKNGGASGPVAQDLLSLLSLGLSVITVALNYPTSDSVMAVHAADIDDDGDMEILLALRNGQILVLNRFGTLKWSWPADEQAEKSQGINTILGIERQENTASLEAESTPAASDKTPRVIIGTREGMVYAFNRYGKECWNYKVGQNVRQICLHPQAPSRIIVASDNQMVFALCCSSGEKLWSSGPLNGAVMCLALADIDGDTQREILVGTAGREIVALDAETGELEGVTQTTSKVSTLAVLAEKSPIILTSENGRELHGWSRTRASTHQLKKSWPRLPTADTSFDSRISALTVPMMPTEQSKEQAFPEIIVSTKDQQILILDKHGELQWRYNVGDTIHSLYAADISRDGQIEILVGCTEGLQVLHVKLRKDLYQDITIMYQQLSEKYSLFMHEEPLQNALLHTLLGSQRQAPPKMELVDALAEIEKHNYESALMRLQRLRQERVDRFWEQPIENLNSLSAVEVGNVAADPDYEVIFATLDGFIYAYDIKNERKERWISDKLPAGVLMLQAGKTSADESYCRVFAILENHSLYVLNHNGKILNPHTFPQASDKVLSIFMNAHGDRSTSQVQEILCGMADNTIYIYDAQLTEPPKTLKTSASNRLLCSYDLVHAGSAEIISCDMDRTLYVYNRSGKKLWEFSAEERIRAVCVRDADQESQAEENSKQKKQRAKEIVIGSEDRNVYVLDRHGRLRWWYHTPDRVLSVDAHDIDHDGNVEILVGVADGYLYVLNGVGDLLWKYNANDTIRSVQAKDLNRDDITEIIIGTETQLHLLRVLDIAEMSKNVTTCWHALIEDKNYTDARDAIYQMIRHPNEYVRALTYSRYATLATLQDKDRERILEGLKDSSFEMKKELVRALAHLHKNDNDPDKTKIVLRKLLAQLATAPEKEIKLALISVLPYLALTGPHKKPELCFEYLKSFSNSADRWIRWTVVRKLDRLLAEYPDETFRLLSQTIHDRHSWIRQESGRCLAHYFERYPKRIITSLSQLLDEGITPEVLGSIAKCTSDRRFGKSFAIVEELIGDINQKNVQKILARAVSAFDAVQDPKIADSITLLLLYREFANMFGARKCQDIEAYQRLTTTEQLRGIARFRESAQILEELQEVINSLQRYRRRESFGDRAASLIETINLIQEIRARLQHAVLLREKQVKARKPTSEQVIFLLLLDHWQEIVKKELEHLRGHAVLRLEMTQRSYQHMNQPITISLTISNDGSCAADNVRVRLQQAEDYEIVGPEVRELPQISTTRTYSIEFTLRLRIERPHLSFEIFYSDVTNRDLRIAYGDILQQETQQPKFQRIISPYVLGTPVRERKMFYGREESLSFLQEQLSITTSNRIVVMTGQRRSGKTSIIYQLKNTELLQPHIPVLLDLQAFALTTSSEQLLLNFATTIHETLQERGVQTPRQLERNDFATGDPSLTFSSYLKNIVRGLQGTRRLILLIDEFELLDQKIQQGKLDEHFPKYLRSVMQHVEGINFLLAGAPSIKHMTDSYWSAFFQLAQQHTLSQLGREAAAALITEPIKQRLEYDLLALEKVHELTGDQPYLLQILADSVIRKCNEKERFYVTINEVNSVLLSVLEKGSNYFGWLWEQSSPLERFLLLVLSQKEGAEGRGDIFSLHDIKKVFDEQELPFPRKIVQETLNSLVDEHILQQGNNADHYILPVGLSRAWLRNHKTLEQVIDEEQLDTLLSDKKQTKIPG